MRQGGGWDAEPVERPVQRPQPPVQTQERPEMRPTQKPASAPQVIQQQRDRGTQRVNDLRYYQQRQNTEALSR